MHIRKATADDLDALDQIMWRACWSNEADRPFLTANPELVTANRGLVEAGQTFVAEENVSVGFATYEKIEEAWELEAPSAWGRCQATSPSRSRRCLCSSDLFRSRIATA